MKVYIVSDTQHDGYRDLDSAFFNEATANERRKELIGQYKKDGTPLDELEVGVLVEGIEVK